MKRLLISLSLLGVSTAVFIIDGTSNARLHPVIAGGIQKPIHITAVTAPKPISTSEIRVTYRDGKTVTMTSKDFHPTETDNAVIATVEYGNGAVVHVPPTDFDPLTAMDEQLDYYNYPRRPKNEDDLKRWRDVMSHAQHFIIPTFGESNDFNEGERK
ncbi:hypothetical protein [Paenibacillus sp. GP183]|uniref:hypothetical protein n=1 Tax=Paenibacillus sp. GP183 TaxID=1882751 RepID=UPI00089D7981|nr:hypothetical protein [Paenibacillus sp. GP183]SEB45634.1 hypothetical protein SAMN05443246_0449 [Paenibacillus sp. GP183]